MTLLLNIHIHIYICFFFRFYFSILVRSISNKWVHNFSCEFKRVLPGWLLSGDEFDGRKPAGRITWKSKEKRLRRNSSTDLRDRMW